jgi:AsmA protein
MKRGVKIGAIVVGVLLLILMAVPFLVDANTFRPKLESEMSDALGRQVKIGNISLSLLSGGVSADDISIADDPAFGAAPFVKAKSLKVGVEMIPLIFSRKLNVTEITLEQPRISLVKSADGETWNFSSLGGKSAAPPKSAEPSASSGPNPSLSVAKLKISDGQLTLSHTGSTQKPRVYDKVSIEVTNLSLTSAFPFTLSAGLPSGGTVKLDGHAGPFVAGNAILTPFDAKATVEKLDLADSAVIDPAMGIAGQADLNGTVSSDGHEAKAAGTLKITNFQAVAKGSPAGRPVQVTYSFIHDLAKRSGTVAQCDIAMGKAVAHLTGTYDAHGAVTVVNLKLYGPNMPVDELQAMLPAVGVELPPKATLKGGDIDINLLTVGPVDKQVTTGMVRLQNTALANFNLGSKLSAISALSGKGSGAANDTTIQNFSSDVRVAPDGTQANNINLTIPALGVVTGGGTVSPAKQLAFKMNASVQGTEVPFAIQGTASDPKFIPDVKGIAVGLLKQQLTGKGLGSGQQGAVSGVMGMFNKKKPH